MTSGTYPRINTLLRRNAVLAILRSRPGGLALRSIHAALCQAQPGLRIGPRTVLRDIKALQLQGFVRSSGHASSIRYFPATDRSDRTGYHDPLSSVKPLAQTQARHCFGDGILVLLSCGSYGMEAIGLHKPLTITEPPNGSFPDLTDFIGSVISFSGDLEVVNGLQREFRLELHELIESPAGTPPSPVHAVFSGRIESAPRLSPNERHCTTLINYGGNAWLIISVDTVLHICTGFMTQKADATIAAYGRIESHIIDEKDMLQLIMRSYLELNPLNPNSIR